MGAKPKQKRLSALQIFLFNSGNTMPALVLSLCSSYMLTFQTKVLGLPSNVVGLLWLAPSAIDAILALLLGYMSDKVTIPLMSKKYGQRKTWHLIGCICLVSLPFLMNVCFPCKGNISGWQVTLYYIFLLQVCYVGWSLTQSNFLALIPEVATKQSEMVKLGAVSTAVTLLGGIFVYVVTWVLLGDDVNSNLSEKQRPAFIKLGLIITGTGAFFQILFHVGVTEPGALGVCSTKEHSARDHTEDEKDTDTNDYQANFGDHKLENQTENSDNENTTKEAPDIKKTLPDDNGTPSHIIPSLEANTQVGEHNRNTETLREMLKQTLPDEQVSKGNQHNDNSSLDSDDGYTSEGMSITDSDNFELFMPDTFIDMVPVPNVILSSRRNSNVSGIGQFISSSRGPSRVASRKFQRSASQKRRASTDIIDKRHYGDSRRGSRFTTYNGFDGSRRPSNMHQQWDDQRVISRHNSKKRWESPSVSQFPSRGASVKKSPLTNELTVSQDEDISIRHPARFRLSLTPEMITEQYVINCNDEPIEGRMEEYFEEEEENVEQKAWKKLLQNPEYYKLGFAYMFTRLAQNMTNSYMPLFLTDWLKYPKIAIAYFPLVILISGVGASFGGKRLNTLLGNKWTFCLGSIMVMGASGWFYLLTPENRSAMYVPAILTGCGTSIMFVTSLALAADFVSADKRSGAFLMASMGLIAKLFNGTLFYLLQEFTPLPVSNPCPECISYVRHVYSLGPGVSAFLGLLTFILFIPATIQCKPIVPMEDAGTQTDESSFTVSTATTHDVIDDQATMSTYGISYFNVIDEDEENETMENSGRQEKETAEMNTAL